MPLLIPFFLGAGATGYWWWSSSEDKEPTFTGELFEVLKPILIILVIVFFLRWAFKKGSTTSANNKS